MAKRISFSRPTENAVVNNYHLEDEPDSRAPAHIKKRYEESKRRDAMKTGLVPRTVSLNAYARISGKLYEEPKSDRQPKSKGLSDNKGWAREQIDRRLGVNGYIGYVAPMEKDPEGLPSKRTNKNLVGRHSQAFIDAYVEEIAEEDYKV